ncbi:MAG: S8 family peptidase [Candidatus Yanofskybacteria bacterium]|nr:S8 family peptidase [Candidatus Yanofskybacteria bacterium]
MNTKKTAWMLVFAVILITSSSAYAAKVTTGEGRYFIKSNANLWKNSLGVRNNFGNGFTADLSDWQLRLVKIFKLEIEPVPQLYVLPATATPEVKLSAATPKKVADRFIPTDQTPWGIELAYQDDALVSTTGGKDVMVAVLDTGVVKTHPDLTRRVADCKDFTTTKPTVTNGKCEDKNGHGTHVAGIIAADGGSDSLGIYGMAPEAKILAYRVCGNNGSCWADDVAMAIRTAVDEKANVINLSLGSDKPSQLMQDAINYATDKGAVVVAAAGNDGPYTGSIDYPAAYQNVIAVGALDADLYVPDWSSRGANSESDADSINEKDIEFGAPGVNIESTWKEGYAILSGTSMAAPHISGLMAKLWNFSAEKPAQDVRKVLKELTLDIMPTGEDNDSGFGFPQVAQ